MGLGAILKTAATNIITDKVGDKISDKLDTNAKGEIEDHQTPEDEIDETGSSEISTSTTSPIEIAPTDEDRIQYENKSNDYQLEVSAALSEVESIEADELSRRLPTLSPNTESILGQYGAKIDSQINVPTIESVVVEPTRVLTPDKINIDPKRLTQIEDLISIQSAMDVYPVIVEATNMILENSDSNTQLIVDRLNEITQKSLEAHKAWHEESLVQRRDLAKVNCEIQTQLLDLEKTKITSDAELKKELAKVHQKALNDDKSNDASANELSEDLPNESSPSNGGIISGVKGLGSTIKNAIGGGLSWLGAMIPLVSYAVSKWDDIKTWLADNTIIGENLVSRELVREGHNEGFKEGTHATEDEVGEDISTSLTYDSTPDQDYETERAGAILFTTNQLGTTKLYGTEVVTDDVLTAAYDDKFDVPAAHDHSKTEERNQGTDVYGRVNGLTAAIQKSTKYAKTNTTSSVIDAYNLLNIWGAYLHHKYAEKVGDNPWDMLDDNASDILLQAYLRVANLEENARRSGFTNRQYAKAYDTIAKNYLEALAQYYGESTTSLYVDLSWLNRKAVRALLDFKAGRAKLFGEWNTDQDEKGWWGSDGKATGNIRPISFGKTDRDKGPTNWDKKVMASLDGSTWREKEGIGNLTYAENLSKQGIGLIDDDVMRQHMTMTIGTGIAQNAVQNANWKLGADDLLTQKSNAGDYRRYANSAIFADKTMDLVPNSDPNAAPQLTEEAENRAKDQLMHSMDALDYKYRQGIYADYTDEEYSIAGEGFTQVTPAKDLGELPEDANRKQRAAYATQYFMNELSLTPEQAAGIVGNLDGESGLDPHIVNQTGEYENRHKQYGRIPPYGYGAGLIQWTNVGTEDSHDGRKDKALKFINDKYNKNYQKLEDSTFEEQLGAVVWEINNRKKLLSSLKQANTIRDSTDIVIKGLVFGSSNTMATESQIPKEWNYRSELERRSVLTDHAIDSLEIKLPNTTSEDLLAPIDGSTPTESLSISETDASVTTPTESQIPKKWDYRSESERRSVSTDPAIDYLGIKILDITSEDLLASVDGSTPLGSLSMAGSNISVTTPTAIKSPEVEIEEPSTTSSEVPTSTTETSSGSSTIVNAPQYKAGNTIYNNHTTVNIHQDSAASAEIR